TRASRTRTLGARAGALGAAFAAIVFLAAALAPARADTAVATKWRLLGEAQSDCMGHARMAIFRSGFDATEPGTESMSGKHGDYTVSIRCVTEQSVVFFVSSGPSPATTARYLEILYQHF